MVYASDSRAGSLLLTSSLFIFVLNLRCSKVPTMSIKSCDTHVSCAIVQIVVALLACSALSKATTEVTTEEVVPSTPALSTLDAAHDSSPYN